MPRGTRAMTWRVIHRGGAHLPWPRSKGTGSGEGTFTTLNPPASLRLERNPPQPLGIAAAPAKWLGLFSFFLPSLSQRAHGRLGGGEQGEESDPCSQPT